MVIVITRWTGRYLSGPRACNSSGRVDNWSCDTIDSSPFAACSWFGSYSRPVFITQNCYNGLTDSEKAYCPRAYDGIIANSGYYETYDTQYYNHQRLVPSAIIKCWSTACFNLRPDLHCEGVVCDPVCIGSDKYSQACVTEGENAGECAFDQLIEANSHDCPGYDPCLDVDCPDKCVDYDLYSQVCEDGVCVRGVLIEADNREICDYDPCRNVDCPDECFGVDKWRMECEEGECIPDRIIEPNCIDRGYIPSEPTCVSGETRGKITCEDGSIIYAEICDNGVWVPTNATCPTGPTPDPEPDKTSLDMILLAGVVVVLFYLFIMRR